MDLLHAASYIELMEKRAKSEKVVSTVPKKVLCDVTNTNMLPKFKSLLHGKLRRSITPEPFLTPKKKRRFSIGKENLSPSTPKHTEKLIEKRTDSPPTPLSNLKLLTKIASTQSPLRSCEVKIEKKNEPAIKKFFTYDFLPGKSDLSDSSLNKYLSSGSEYLDQSPFLEPSRKEKSLGVLVEKFLHHFPLKISCMQTPRKIAIDEVAVLLSTERRRVYDIINILESLSMAERVEKNAYQWRGKQLLENTLSRLKRLAVQWGVQPERGVALNYPDPQLDQKVTSSPDPFNGRKGKSLGVLCQKFMMLLLLSPAPHTVHLDAAISFLLGHSMDSSNQNRTKGRRIYDIANVLMSIGLVKRLPQSKSFQYVGPLIETSKLNQDIYTQPSKTRHSLLSPCEVVLSDGKSIGMGRPQLDVTPSTSKMSEMKENCRRTFEEIAPKAKRNCLVTSAQSNSVPKKIAQLTKSTENEKLFKLPPVDAGIGKARRLFEQQPAQIVSVSKAKSVTYIHPNMKNLQHNTTRVALTFDKMKEKENIFSPKIKKPQFCTATSSRSNFTSTNSAVPKMFVGNSIGPLHIPVENNNLHGSCSGPVIVDSQKSLVRAIGYDENKISLPSINLNTLSKSHYKTVIGPVPSKPHTFHSNPGYRFVIKNKTRDGCSPVYRVQSNNEFIQVVNDINENSE